MTIQRKWTEAEDEVLYKEVDNHPYNRHQCFLAVAQRLDRSPGAVQTRWYTKVSKDPRYCCFFTLSRHHIAINRTNSKGLVSTSRVFNRIARLLHLI